MNTTIQRVREVAERKRADLRERYAVAVRASASGEDVDVEGIAHLMGTLGISATQFETDVTALAARLELQRVAGTAPALRRELDEVTAALAEIDASHAETIRRHKAARSGPQAEFNRLTEAIREAERAAKQLRNMQPTDRPDAETRLS